MKLYNDKAYSRLYSSMKNPSSLSVKNVTGGIVLYYKDFETYYKQNSKVDEDYTITYNKEFPIFHITITIKYSGTNSFGGNIIDTINYAYMGRINQDYSISDIEEKMAVQY